MKQLRSPEDILDEFTTGKKGLFGDEIQCNFDDAIEAVKQAQREAIEAAAEVATTRTNDESTSIIVDKQSILNLLKS